jgi:purine nucleosidase
VLEASEVLLPDPLAMAVVLEPQIVLDEERCVIEVEMNGTLARGQTVVVPTRLAGGRPSNCRVIKRVDQTRLEEALAAAAR